MKRFLAALTAIIFIFSLSIQSTLAAENGDMLITSEKVTGEVGDILKVEFYLYANLPEDRKLDSLSGSLKYDPEFLSFGTINQEDKDENLSSFMKGKVSSFQYNLVEPGLIKFVYIDAYGVEAEGFWFQAEFRIEKEGATDFIFNGITYTGIDSEYHTVSFYIEPVSVGGIYTEGETVPEDGAADETFAPVTPAVETPVTVTPTPKPNNSGQTVPVVSTLPTVSSDIIENTGTVTLPPAVTSMPVTTPSQQNPETQTKPENTASAETDVQQPSDPVVEGNDPVNPIPDVESTSGSNPGIISDEQVGNGKQNNGERYDIIDADEAQPNTMIVIGVIIGIVAVLGLGALAIVLILKRRGMQD